MNIGGQITISGSGQEFENFQTSGVIEKLTGLSQKPVTFYEPDFKTAPLRIMNLDESYYGMQYDLRDSKNTYVKILII